MSHNLRLGDAAGLQKKPWAFGAHVSMKQLRQKAPLLLGRNGENDVVQLRPVHLEKKGAGSYDELWLQKLVASLPQVLPIQDIEPAFSPAFTICTELPLGAKFLDILLVTALGNLVAVECKLWRNPEARREVIAQAIEYAAMLQRLNHHQLQDAIRRARKDSNFSLYQHVVKEGAEPEPSLREADFTDAVSRNLRNGRCLLLIVGDGHHEETEAMSGFLQQHAGAHFTLALVDLKIYEAPGTEQRLIVPSVPLQTTSIVRGIVRIEDAGISVTPPPVIASSARPTTLTEDEFFEGLDKICPGTATTLRTFLDTQEDLHLEYEVQKTLIVRMIVGKVKLLPFIIRPDGQIDTDYNYDKKDLIRAFTEYLAASIPGAFVKETPKTLTVKRSKQHGGPPTVWDILNNQAGCRAALELLHQAMMALLDVSD